MDAPTVAALWDLGQNPGLALVPHLLGGQRVGREFREQRDACRLCTANNNRVGRARLVLADLLGSAEVELWEGAANVACHAS